MYKIAQETPLQEAKQLSKQTGNSILLKREDLQVGVGSGGWGGRGLAGGLKEGWQFVESRLAGGCRGLAGGLTEGWQGG